MGFNMEIKEVMIQYRKFVIFLIEKWNKIKYLRNFTSFVRIWNLNVGFVLIIKENLSPSMSNLSKIFECINNGFMIKKCKIFFWKS